MSKSTSLPFISPDKRKVVQRLIKMNVLDVKFDGKIITFRFDRHQITNHVRQRKHLGWVGEWSRNSDIIYYDDELVKYPKELLCVPVHESIEKYLNQFYGLNENAEGHYVATIIEQKFAKNIGVNWHDYNWRIEFISKDEYKYYKGKKCTK